jgi:hypothetical protein
VDLAPGDMIEEVDCYQTMNAVKLAKRLTQIRDAGTPFDVKLASGRTVRVTPLKVCRGRTLLALPGKHAEQQGYHWLQTIHPEQIASVPLTPDEAQWVVLWTQGLSAEGSLRMQAYQARDGMPPPAVVTTGAGPAAAESAFAAGGSFDSTASAVALAQTPLMAARIATAAADNDATLYGINRAALSAFPEADRWAFARMPLLGMDPRAAVTLALKLAQAGATRNAFLLDKERQAQMDALIANVKNENGAEVGEPLTDAGTAAPLEEAAPGASEPHADDSAVTPEVGAAPPKAN